MGGRLSDRALWLILCSIPVPISVAISIERGWNVGGALFFVSLISPTVLLIFVARFQTIFTNQEFVYRRWGPTIRIAYSDIAGVEVTIVTPIAIGAFVIAKNGKNSLFGQS
jgi:hypothetical protein